MVAYVVAGSARRPRNLRRDPVIAVTVRAGWQWTTVEGRAELIGPADPHPRVDAEGLRLLLREIFVAAGGTHDDWDDDDRAMRDERRTAVLVGPTRVYANPGARADPPMRLRIGGRLMGSADVAAVPGSERRLR